MSAKVKIIATLPVIVLILAINLDSFFLNYNFKKSIPEKDVLYRAIGDLKETIGIIFWLKSDEYFHSGVTRIGNESCLKKQTEECDATQSHAKEKICRFDFISAINQHVRITGHRHLSGNEKIEMAPWIFLAAKLNPHNVDAYVTGTYWLSEILKKTNEALHFLEQGRASNPADWRIYDAFGRIYFILEKDYVKSAQYYKQSFMMMDDRNCDIFDKKQVLTFLAASFEKSGKYDQAIEYFGILHDLSGPDKVLEDRIEKLKNLL